jgi:hypothetical protein
VDALQDVAEVLREGLVESRLSITAILAIMGRT